MKISKTLITLLIAIVSTQSFAQKEYAKEILDSLCSPRYDGRGYVNNGDNRAADFIINELQEIGVSSFKKKDFKQKYTFNVNTFPSSINLILDQDTLEPGAEYLVHPNSGTAAGDFLLEEVNSSNFKEKYKSELRQRTKEQKIYAFNFTDVEDKKERNKYKSFAFSAMDYYPIIWVETSKQMYSVGRKRKNYPLFTVDSSSYFKANTTTIKVNSVYKQKHESTNVIGMLPGKKKKKYVVFSAHYDHLGRMGSDTYFPGANDNASGVAMLLSLAKYYKNHPPKYSIVFCFFSGEEAGLEGSKYFVQHPYFKLKKVKFVLNIDIMGSASEGITVVNGSKHENAFKTLSAINKEENYLSLIKKRGPTANSDHHFFSESGVPSFFIYSVGDVKNYHDIYDTAENTSLKNFDKVQELLVKFVTTL